MITWSNNDADFAVLLDDPRARSTSIGGVLVSTVTLDGAGTGEDVSTVEADGSAVSVNNFCSSALSGDCLTSQFNVACPCEESDSVRLASFTSTVVKENPSLSASVAMKH